nr:hypothetical protein [Tanacetum cinerariifolium]
MWRTLFKKTTFLYTRLTFSVSMDLLSPQEVILNGYSPGPTRVVDGVLQLVAPTTAEQKFGRKNELEAHENLDQIHDRLQKLVSQLEIYGVSLSQEDVNLKFLRSLRSKWKTHTLIWRNKADLEEQSLDDLSHTKQNKDEDAAFDGKEHDFDAKKPKSEVNVSPSSSAQTRKQDDKTKKEAKGKSLVESLTRYKDLNVKYKGSSDDSIREVNTAGFIVFTIGQISPNSTNIFSAAGPSNVAASPIYRRSSFIDASQLHDDPDMPELEDIIYSDDDDDVGAEADFNNLETSITISPILTTRVYKDHPKEPKRVHQALKDPSWIEAMQEELLQFKMQKEEEINYEEVFAPVARIEAIGLLLAYASFMGFMVYQMDVKSAFLYGTIEEEVYVYQPPGFKDLEHPDNIYVEDIIFGATNKDLCKAFAKLMKDKFRMSSMGELTFFLGLQVKQKKDGIFISQDKYVAKIVRMFRLNEGKSASTLIDTEKPLLKDLDGEDVDVHTYRSMIGSLMYLTSSRPDFIITVCACARFQVTLKASHLHAVKKIFRYLKGKPHLGLWYPKCSPFDLVAFSDSDYAGASPDRKSTTRGCQSLGCRLISWQCKKQTVVATSSIEAEYVAAASCYAQIDKDDAVVLMDEKEEEKKVEKAKIDKSAQVQGRQAESRVEIYKIDMDHASKVLSMQKDELLGIKCSKAFPLLVMMIPLLVHFATVKFGDSYKAPPEETGKGPTSASFAKKKGRTVVITTEDMQKRRNDVKARTTLLLALPDEHQLRFSKNKDDLDTMSLDDVYNHLKVYELEVQKKSESNSQNMAFISSSNTSSRKCEVPTASVPTASIQVSTASIDVAAASLSHDTVCGFWKKIGKKITIQGSDVAGFVKSKVECFNCHKIDHFAKEGRAPRSQDRGKRESYKQGPEGEEPALKALMAIDDIGWD